MPLESLADLTPLTAPASAESFLLLCDTQSPLRGGHCGILTFPVFLQSSAACLTALHLAKAETCPSPDGAAEAPSSFLFKGEPGREQRLPGLVVPLAGLARKFVELPLGVVGSWEPQPGRSRSLGSQKRGGNGSFLNGHTAPM